jgi:hypothetical protein
MFDDNCAKMILITAPALATRMVAPRDTYNYGARDEFRGWSLAIRDGKLFEKTRRRINFFDSKKIVKS